jgi:hypothetical protein
MTPPHRRSHADLLRLFRESTGHTEIPVFREPSMGELVGHQRSRVRRFSFMPPRDWP